MALFSRRKKTGDSEPAAESGTREEPAAQVDPQTEAAASVGISVSSFQGLGGDAPPERHQVVAVPPTGRSSRTSATSRVQSARLHASSGIHISR